MADFTVMEDGVPQKIEHFLTLSLASGTPISPDSPLAGAVTGQRAFLIILGRGPLNTAVKALDALIDFVRTKLLPGDRLGVMGYLRATELDADREQIVRFLERYRDGHAPATRGGEMQG